MARVNWANVRAAKLSWLADQQRRDDNAYTHDLRVAERMHPPPPPVSKVQMRAELGRLMAGVKTWGPWSEWQTVIRNGTTMQERMRQRHAQATGA